MTSLWKLIFYYIYVHSKAIYASPIIYMCTFEHVFLVICLRSVDILWIKDESYIWLAILCDELAILRDELAILGDELVNYLSLAIASASPESWFTASASCFACTSSNYCMHAQNMKHFDMKTACKPFPRPPPAC